jgi:predicted MFS family arabinose efflux permease
VGGLTGGGLLGAVGGAIGWAGMFQLMAALCLVVLLVMLAVREPEAAAAEGKRGPAVRETVQRLLQVARSPGTSWVLLFVATYKLGETAADRMFQPFLVDHHIEAWRTTLWLGTYGMVASLLGSVGGGLLAGRMRLLSAVTVTAGLRVLPLVAQLALVAGLFPVTAQSVIPITCAEHFFGGALTTAMFAFMMSRVDRRIGATHFTLLASVEVLGKSLPGLLSGAVAERWGYPPVYAFAVAASVAFLVLVGPVRGVLRAEPPAPDRAPA